MSSDNAMPAGDGAAGAATEGGADMQAELTRIESELHDANDRVLRVQAELENYRKRVRRELDDERKYAAVPLLNALFPVVDNLQRAIESAEQTGSASGLLEGVKMVAAQLQGAFEQQSCQRIPAVGLPFDPNRHEALAQEPSAEHPSGVVTREVRAGYKLHDRVLRPAQVFVSTGTPS